MARGAESLLFGGVEAGTYDGVSLVEDGGRGAGGGLDAAYWPVPSSVVTPTSSNAGSATRRSAPFLATPTRREDIVGRVELG